MRTGFSAEEYAHDAKMSRISWSRTDEQDQTWAQKLTMLLHNLLEDEHHLEQALEDAEALSKAANDLLKELAKPPKKQPPGKPVKLYSGKKPPPQYNEKHDRNGLDDDFKAAVTTTLDEVADLLSKGE